MSEQGESRTEGADEAPPAAAEKRDAPRGKASREQRPRAPQAPQAAPAPVPAPPPPAPAPEPAPTPAGRKLRPGLVIVEALEPCFDGVGSHHQAGERFGMPEQVAARMASRGKVKRI